MKVLPHLVVFSGDLDLYSYDFGARLGWLILIEPSFASSETKIYRGERLYVAIMQITSYGLTLGRAFEIVHACLELLALVGKETDYVAGDCEVGALSSCINSRQSAKRTKSPPNT